MFLDCFSIGRTDSNTSREASCICCYKLASNLMIDSFCPFDVLKNAIISLAICYTVNDLPERIFSLLLKMISPFPTLPITNNTSIKSLISSSVFGGFLTHFSSIFNQYYSYSIEYLYPKCA